VDARLARVSIASFMAALVSRCSNCGAPLERELSQQLVSCAYCQVVNDLGSTVRPSRPLEVPRASPHKRGPLLAIVLSGAVVIVGISAVASRGGAGFGSVFREWYSVPCAVDANSDGVLDVAGRGAAPGSERWAPMIIDGRTGRALWSGMLSNPTSRTLCLGPAGFAVDDEDFKLHLFAARAPEVERTVPLPDHVSEYGVGDGCIRLKLANASTVLLSQQGESVGRCDATPPVRPDLPPGISSSSEPMTVTAGSRSFELTTRQPGTPFLTLSASENGRPSWRRDLPFIAANGGRGLTIAGELVAVYGAEPRGDEYGVLIGVDASSGAQRFAVPQNSHWSGHVRGLLFNGQYIIASWGFGLHAYDPADGKRVWNIGGR
jgi:hypothetical protein